MSSEFSCFVHYTWCFFLAGLVIRAFCWTIGYSAHLLGISLGGHNTSR